jgi:hypothetical protein
MVGSTKHGRAELFTSGMGMKEQRRESWGPDISFNGTPPMTRRSPIKFCLLKFPPPSNNTKLGTKPFLSGMSIPEQYHPLLWFHMRNRVLK